MQIDKKNNETNAKTKRNQIRKKEKKETDLGALA